MSRSLHQWIDSLLDKSSFQAPIAKAYARAQRSAFFRSKLGAGGFMQRGAAS